MRAKRASGAKSDFSVWLYFVLMEEDICYPRKEERK